MNTVNLLQHRLETAEEDFLDALLRGASSLELFEAQLTTLQDDVEAAISHGVVSNSTIAVAGSVGSRISKLAECFLQMERKQKDLTESLHNDLDRLFCGVGSVEISSFSSPSSGARSPTPSYEGSHPPFIAAAFKWLLENLHNPYPSSEVKAAIARSCESPLSSINSWFIGARRRMGWTAICRDYFHNSRTEAVDAARRALLQQDPDRKVPAEIVQTFMAMKVAAEGLYSTTFVKSSLANELDTIIQDVVEGNGRNTKRTTHCIEEKHIRETGDHAADKRSIEPPSAFQVTRSYPSPRSPLSSPLPLLEPSLSDESDDEDDVLPPIIAGRKRKASSCSSEINSLCFRGKRARLQEQISTLIIPSSLPSPQDSVIDHRNVSALSTSKPPLPSPPTSFIPPSRSCKRRLSSSSPRKPKCPRGLHATPRLHAVSDPLPVSSSYDAFPQTDVDDWFNTNFTSLFDVPTAVEASELDLSLQWEVELFSDYSIPPNPARFSGKNIVPQSDRAAPQQNSESVDYGLLDDVLQSLGDYPLCNHNDSASIVSDIRAQPPPTSVPALFQPFSDGEHLDVADADYFRSDPRLLSPGPSVENDPILGFSDILANAVCGVDQQLFYNGMGEVSL